LIEEGCYTAPLLFSVHFELLMRIGVAR